MRAADSTASAISEAAREGVFAVGHEDDAGVATFSGEGDAEGGGGGDGGDGADGEVFFFEEGALLDVELDEGAVVVFGEEDLFEGASHSGGGAGVVDGFSVGVFESAEFFQGEGAGEDAGA